MLGEPVLALGELLTMLAQSYCVSSSAPCLVNDNRKKRGTYDGSTGSGEGISASAFVNGSGGSAVANGHGYIVGEASGVETGGEGLTANGLGSNLE